MEYNNNGLGFEMENMDKALIFIANEILFDEDREKEKISALRAIASTRDTLKQFMLPDDLKINS